MHHVLNPNLIYYITKNEKTGENRKYFAAKSDIPRKKQDLGIIENTDRKQEKSDCCHFMRIRQHADSSSGTKFFHNGQI